MIPYLRGSTRWAVVLCRFSDIPEPSEPRSYFTEFFTEAGAGRGGLWDYWRDISNGAVDLSGSTVLGWYTMQYSFRERWSGGRDVWIDEAIRLAQRDVDLRDYFGVVAVVNAPVQDSALGRPPREIMGRRQEFGLLALNMSGPMGQRAWRHCGDCQGMYYERHLRDGICPSDPAGTREHRPSGPTQYLVVDGAGRLPDPHESGWRWCSNCEGLWYQPGNPAPCPNGRNHVANDSAEYELVYNLPGFPYQAGFRRCQRCRGLAHGASAGACPSGGAHVYDMTRDYTMLRDESHVEVTFAAHEMGHGYGFNHSFRAASPDVEYGDPWDLMSAMAVTTFFGRRGPSGPGMNAPSLMKLGWFPESRASLSGGSVTLAPLNRPDLPGSLAARRKRGDRVYTVELRAGSGWDTGFNSPAVLIHELRGGYTEKQNGWRWCLRCESLFYAGAAACPAGGVHALAGSAEYVVALEDPGAAGQPNWRWCRKCQGLVFGGNPLAPCPGGGEHALNESGNYTLPLNNSSATPLQDHQWRHCTRCQGLVGRRSGVCVRGGGHQYDDRSQYRVGEDSLIILSPVQRDWRWCRKCEGLFYWGASRCAHGGLHDLLGSSDYAVALNDETSSGQPNWRWCRRCQCLAHDRPAPCVGGQNHDFSRSGQYKVGFEGSTAGGQRDWRWCDRCQGLAHGEGRCPAGGGHRFSGQDDYAVISFGDDISVLLPYSSSQFDWPPGSAFADRERGVEISIGEVSSERATVTITLGD